MNNEIILDLEVLKINHDEEIEKIMKKYPYEEGYNIDVTSCIPIDTRREKLKIKITSSLDLENQKEKAK